MNLKLLEPFREWVYKTRRRNGSQKPSGLFGLEDARKPQVGDNRPEAASDGIILRLEPDNAFAAGCFVETGTRLGLLQERQKD